MNIYKEDAFDWWYALDHPEDFKYGELFTLAKSWVTCACGNLCDRIPRDVDGEPKDRKLSNLGIYFYDCVVGEHWVEAKETLQKIEIRTVELLK